MTVKLQFRRDTTANRMTVIPDVGEPFWDTDTDKLYIGDGATTGGALVTSTGNGTVTSITFSGGVTGLSVSGGTITTSGTLTLSGTLAIANGGTGQTTRTASLNALLPDQSGNSGYILSTDGANASWIVAPSGVAGSAAGTVTQVGMDGGFTGFTFSGGPVTTSGTFSMGGTLGIGFGGTGQTSKSAAFAALSPISTLGDLLYGATAGANSVLSGNTTTSKKFLSQTGTGTASASPAWTTLSSSDVGLGNVENTAISSWAGSTNIVTTGPIATGSWVASTIALAYGGTGAVTATAACNNILPSQTSFSNYFLTTDGSNASWGLPVYSVAASSTCGLTWGGSPITTSGTLTLGGILAVANGGTDCATTASAINALVPDQSTASGKFLTSDGSAVSWGNPAGSGTITSVAATTDTGLVWGGSPITTSGTLSLSGTVNVASGGTGQTTATAAANALLSVATAVSGLYLTNDGSTYQWVSLGTGGTVTSIDFDGSSTGLTVSGGPITTAGVFTLGGTLAIPYGGTGANTTADALNALLPDQTSSAGKVLTTSGSVASWTTVSTSGFPKQLGYAGIF